MSKRVRVADTPPQPTAPQDRLAIEDFQNLLQTIRIVRDKKLYLRDGFNSFREWTMNRFGERLGAWIEETL